MCATTIIAKNGDVILQVLKDTETSVRLLVSSNVLSLASHVFEAMFDGRFAEGQDLSSASPKTIQLTDDNPECMTMLCRLIHLQNSDIPFDLELDALIDLAILCDKYDCADSVRPWSKIWVSHLLSDTEKNSCEKLITVSYLLDLPHEFMDASERLIRHRRSLDKEQFTIHGHDFIPEFLIDRTYDNHRRHQIEAIVALQPKLLLDLLDHSENCQKAKDLTLAVFRNLKSANLFPYQALSLAEYQERFEVFEMKELKSTVSACSADFCVGRKINHMKTAFRIGLDAVVRSGKSNCLDCIITESTGDTASVARPCRVFHT